MYVKSKLISSLTLSVTLSKSFTKSLRSCPLKWGVEWIKDAPNDALKSTSDILHELKDSWLWVD